MQSGYELFMRPRFIFSFPFIFLFIQLQNRITVTKSQKSLTYSICLSICQFTYQRPISLYSQPHIPTMQTALFSTLPFSYFLCFCLFGHLQIEKIKNFSFILFSTHNLASGPDRQPLQIQFWAQPENIFRV